MSRDLTLKQYYAALARHDFEPQSFCYVRDSQTGVEFYGPNGGNTRREQLAYLLAARTRRQKLKL